MVWEEELEQWAQWVEQAIFLLLLQKAPLDPLQAAFQLELQVLEDLPLELLHNLEGWEQEEQLVDYLVQALQWVVLLPPTIPTIFL